MIENIINAFKSYISKNDVLAGTYQTKDTDQEKEIIELLTQSGLIHLGHGSKQYKERNISQSGFYTQPNGSQNNPDVLIWDKGKTLEISCKSTKGRVCFNSARPNEEVLYVIDNNKHRCIKTGKEILTENVNGDVITTCNKYQEKLKEICVEANQELKEMNASIMVYERKAYYATIKFTNTNFDNIKQHIINKL